MIGQIITQTPIWVWALLAGLVWLGAKALGKREVSSIVIYLMPLLGLLSVRALVALGVGPLVWGIFALAWLVGLWVGRRVEPRWILGKSGARVWKAGEGLTMAQVLVLFSLNYIRSVMLAVAPGVAAGFAFGAGFAVLAGVTAGLFAGRSLAVYLHPEGPVA
ncbi:DUF6622 family protein [Rhodalgimonas zhirmunskyi]|uniref:DUF1453 domain-containing protein n=1 Tax=Rhodalgimonas zhirmunskyi TaxID=2964767 RepID=A0AAJ1X7I7_9RHOB|nr:DUF6622 family protein [Rhodoalgimonas zhirmunskyi]MDQ2095739.1 hypothetical protein [Rhodoalgimonas zhirmunskyi]